jgi:hypothetical protein
MRLQFRRDDRGATAVLVALVMVLLMGIAAVAIDLGLGFNERRQAQSAADVGVMAGAIEAPGSPAEIRDQILDFTQRNVIGSYSDWQEKWETCTDSERLAFNAQGFRFVPVPAPAGWSVSQLDCISIDQGGFVRVALPSLEFDTYFARALGIDELQTRADAIARIVGRGGGGVLPFGLLSTAGEGQHVCLRDSSGGHAEEPCDGPDTGNFGAIESPHYGTLPDGPSRNCNGAPKSDVLAVNIAIGIDHLVTIDLDGLAANRVEDTCANMDAGHTPDALNTFQGIGQGFEQGIATGPVPGGFTPRLQQGSNPKRYVHGYELDDKPLWEYINPALTSSQVPASCVRGSFNPGPPVFDYSIPADGIADAPNSWQHMSYCLNEYLTTLDPDGDPWNAVLFLDVDGGVSIADSPRFAYVPQFWESTWPPGNSQWRHIRRFKATWVQATWWKRGNTVNVFHPGEPGNFNAGGNWHIIQLSGMVIPDRALPQSLRGDPPPQGGLSPFVPELYR